MSIIIDEINKEQIEALSAGKEIPRFRAGDTLKVGIKINEGAVSRIQYYEGTCIGRKNRSINSSFTVRKISHDQGTEKAFYLYSPGISSIEVLKYGVVRRSKLNYLRNLKGKATKIKEKMTRSTKN